MDPAFEDNIPFTWIVAGFVILTVSGQLLRRYLRERHLRNQGQIETNNGRIPTIQERLASNKAWASGKIKSTGLTPVICLWLAALAWNLTFGVSFINFLFNPAAPLGGKIALGVLSLGGPVFIYFAVRFSIRYFKYGRSLCLIEGKAGVLGKEIKGRIQTTVKVEATGDYVITLECLDIYTTGTGKNSRTHTDSQFQTKQTVNASGINSIHGIPFEIPLPPYPRETGDQLARGKITWQLRIDAPAKGADYTALFVVPVFKVS